MRRGEGAGVLIGFEKEEDWFEYRLENHPEFLRRIASARRALRFDAWPTGATGAFGDGQSCYPLPGPGSDPMKGFFCGPIVHTPPSPPSFPAVPSRLAGAALSRRVL